MGKFCPKIKLAYGIRGNKSKSPTNVCTGQKFTADDKLVGLLSVRQSPPTVDRGVPLQEQIVIGTPGTILDWCTKYKLIDPKKITMFVLDEADVMIATQGHRDQSIRIHR